VRSNHKVRDFSELVEHFSYVLGDKYCRMRKESNFSTIKLFFILES
jgi:hypothetical protein